MRVVYSKTNKTVEDDISAILCILSPINHLHILSSFINLFICLSTIYLYFNYFQTYSSVYYQPFIYTSLIHQPIHQSPINHLSILPSFVNLYICLLSTIYLYFPHSLTYSFIYLYFSHLSTYSSVFNQLFI